MKSHHVLFAFAAGTLLVLSSGCSKRSNTDDEEQGHAKPVVSVRCVPLMQGRIALTVSATGRIDVLRREKMFSPVAGIVTTLNVLEGSSVHAGAPLAIIVTKESHAAIVGAEELLRSAATDQQKAEAERTLRLARSSQNSVTIAARFDGIISARNISAGELVSENSELLTILDLSSAVFIAEVPVREIGRVHVGEPARVRLSSGAGTELHATVDAILPQSDPQSQAGLVRLRFTGDITRWSLHPDIRGTADIVAGMHTNVLLVPRAAVLRDDEKNSFSVVIVTKDSLAVSVPVDVEASNDSLVEVRNPVLHAGMPVIVEGHYMIPDSTTVTIRPGTDR